MNHKVVHLLALTAFLFAACKPLPATTPTQEPTTIPTLEATQTPEIAPSPSPTRKPSTTPAQPENIPGLPAAYNKVTFYDWKVVEEGNEHLLKVNTSEGIQEFKQLSLYWTIENGELHDWDIAKSLNNDTFFLGVESTFLGKSQGSFDPPLEVFLIQNVFGHEAVEAWNLSEKEENVVRFYHQSLEEFSFSSPDDLIFTDLYTWDMCLSMISSDNTPAIQIQVRTLCEGFIPPPNLNDDGPLPEPKYRLPWEEQQS